MMKKNNKKRTGLFCCKINKNGKSQQLLVWVFYLHGILIQSTIFLCLTLITMENISKLEAVGEWVCVVQELTMKMILLLVFYLNLLQLVKISLSNVQFSDWVWLTLEDQKLNYKNFLFQQLLILI